MSKAKVVNYAPPYATAPSIAEIEELCSLAASRTCLPDDAAVVRAWIDSMRKRLTATTRGARALARARGK
jgi:hypothetical protein